MLIIILVLLVTQNCYTYAVIAFSVFFFIVLLELVEYDDTHVCKILM